MNVLENVRQARASLKSRGASEHKHRDAVEGLFTRAQTLIAEMNTAKLTALREAEKPFLAELKEIDDEMSMLIKLIG